MIARDLDPVALAIEDFSRTRLVAFVRESNLIEEIYRDPTQQEVEAHERFLELPVVGVSDLEIFVADVAGAKLRRHTGQNVRVSPHTPLPGGPKIEAELSELLIVIANTVEGHSRITPWEAHVEYETLHPFGDGNGRSGRALWAWQMLREGRDPFALGFLRAWYYASLDGARQ